MFAVDAFFVGGALDIQISGVGETNANLLADGSDFFVDTNNNLTFELGETRGAIADLQSVHAFSNDSVGKLIWNGDFSLAPLAIPLGTGDVVRTEGLSQVHLQAPWTAGGNVSLSAQNAIEFDASIFVQGNLIATVSPGGTILDGANADIHISGDAFLQSQNTIQLGDEATSAWSIVGITDVTSQGDIQLGLLGSWDSTNIRAIGNNIIILNQNTISLVEIQSSGDFELTALGNITDAAGAHIQAAAMNLNATGSIRLTDNAGDSIHVSGAAELTSVSGSIELGRKGTQGISAMDLTIEAGTFAHLGSISVDRLTATVFANGTLNDSRLFVLNAAADRNGQSYLDAVGENLPPGVSTVDHLWSGETLGELKSRASFIQSFGREYGLFVQNNKELTIDGIQATGDGIHVLIETAVGTDLIVAGSVTQRFTQNDPGGLVLIAGERLVLNASAELRIENVAQDLATSRVVKQPNLIASAFDGGRGPTGYESTRDVLYEADAFANTGIQNVLQRVSTQFGVRDEAGFQTLIRYADGSSQLFDANQELANSLQSNPSANSQSGVLPAFVSSAGDAAVVERSTPYSDTFLGTFQTLPTTAIFRRSAEFFLFEHAGATDASVAKVDLTPAVDLVEHVLSPGRKISFSMPSEIAVTPAILVAPIRIAPDTPSSISNLASDLEPSVQGDAMFEVFIVNVGFEDANRDGQPSDPELPSRSEVQIDAVVTKSKSTEPSEQRNDDNTPKQTNLAPGQLNTLTKDIKGSKIPTAADINSWIEEYRNDPSKPSGAYAVISVDSVTGAKVLRVFGVRDFEVADPNPSRQNESLEKPEVQPENKPPKVLDETDKTTSVGQRNADSAVVQLGPLARSLRAMRRSQAESQ